MITLRDLQTPTFDIILHDYNQDAMTRLYNDLRYATEAAELNCWLTLRLHLCMLHFFLEPLLHVRHDGSHQG